MFPGCQFWVKIFSQQILNDEKSLAHSKQAENEFHKIEEKAGARVIVTLPLLHRSLNRSLTRPADCLGQPYISTNNIETYVFLPNYQ